MDDTKPKPTPDAKGEDAGMPRDAVWGRVRSGLADELITTRLEGLSKRGELAGYSRTPAGWSFQAFGSQIDSRVEMVREGGGETFVLRSRLERKPLWIIAITTAIAVWPGSWLTDSMLRSYFAGYDWNTYLWYIPLTVLPVPWMVWKVVKGSRRAAWEHFLDVLPRVVGAVDGTTV